MLPSSPFGWMGFALIASLIVIALTAYSRDKRKWLNNARRLAILAALYPGRSLTGMQICQLVPAVNAAAIYRLLDDMDGSWIAKETLVPSDGRQPQRNQRHLYRITSQGREALLSNRQFDFLTWPGETVGR